MEDDRCYFIIHGLPQPMKLKLAARSAFKSLFAAVPLSFASEGCAFFWNELKLDPNCTPRDYGLSTGSAVVHTVHVRMPVPVAGGGGTPRAAARALPAQAQPTVQDAVNQHLYGTTPPTHFHTVPNTGLKSISGVLAAEPDPRPPGAANAASGSNPQQATYIEELQHAVRYHSECSSKIAEELLLLKAEHAEQTDFHTTQKAKLLERIEQLEQNLTERDKARMVAAEQALQSLQQHVFLFESQRQQYQSEIDGLQLVTEQLRAENRGLEDRCEQVRRERCQLEETNDMESQSHSETEHRLRAQIASLEDDLCLIVGIKETNRNLLTQIQTLEGDLQTSAISQRTLATVETEVDELRSKLVQMTEEAVDARDQCILREAGLLRQLQDTQRSNESLLAQVGELEARVHVPTASEAQLHARLREVMAHNQRLAMLVAAPSSASTTGSTVPTVVPGCRTSPGGTEMAYAHHSARIDSIIRELSPRGSGAMEPPAAPVVAAIASNTSYQRPPSPMAASGYSQQQQQQQPVYAHQQSVYQQPPSPAAGGMFASQAAAPMVEPGYARDAPPLAPTRSSIKPRSMSAANFAPPPQDPAPSPLYPNAPPTSSVTSPLMLAQQPSSTDLTPTNQSFEGRPSLGGSRAESPFMANEVQQQQGPSPQRRASAAPTFSSGGAAPQTVPAGNSPMRARSMFVAPAGQQQLQRTSSPQQLQQQQQQQRVTTPPQRISPRSGGQPPQQLYSSQDNGGGGDSASPRGVSPRNESSFQQQLQQLQQQHQQHQQQQMRQPSSAGMQRSPTNEQAAAEQQQQQQQQQQLPLVAPPAARSQSFATRLNAYQFEPEAEPEAQQPPAVNVRRESSSQQQQQFAGASSSAFADIPMVGEEVQMEQSVMVSQTTTQLSAAAPGSPGGVRLPTSRAKSTVNLPAGFRTAGSEDRDGPPRDLSTRGRKLSMHRKGTADPSGGQSIQYADSGVAAARFEPLHAMLQNCVKLAKDQPALILEPAALSSGEDGESAAATVVTWKQYYDQSLAAGRAMMAQNVAPSETIALLGEKCLSFFYAYLGAMMVGCLPVCLQNPLVVDHKRVLTDLQPSIVFIDSPKGLKGVLGLRNTITSIKNIVVCKGLIPPVVKTAHRDFVLTWEEFLEKAGWVTAEMILERQASIQVENCATVVFTSGTSQQARGVMLSHDSLQFAASAFIDTQDWATERGKAMRGISHGHISSIYTQLYDIVLPVVYTGLGIGNFCVHVPASDVTFNLPALYRLIKATRPTMVFGTPDFWELVAMVMRGNSALGKLSSPMAVETSGSPMHRAASASRRDSTALVASPDLVMIGLEQCTLALWGDRAWKSSTLNYFREIGFRLYECYGLTECCGLAVVSSATKNGASSCGVRLKGSELRVARKDDRDAPGTGEMLVRGRHLMMGYYRFPSLTKDAIDAAGWFHTGDIGQIDEGAMLYYVARATEMVQNTNGEFINLSSIEDGVRSVCPYIGTIVAFGENRDINICMVYLKTRRDPQTGVSTEDLDAEAAAVNPDVRTTSGARSDKQWQQVIARAIQQYNSSAHCLAPNHKVSRFAFMQSEPSVDGGEFAVGSKLRRGSVIEKYHLVLERLYSATTGKGDTKSPRVTRSNTIM